MTLWSAQAPSNIALIKYMGKDESGLPTNASLSYTLAHLQTRVEIEESERSEWGPLKNSAFSVSLSEAGERKFLVFFATLCERWKIPGHYRLSSGNDFPSDCGLASSASSFAALTLAAYELAKTKGDLPSELSREELSAISQKGSGSSCRSFFPGWSLWEREGARAIELPQTQLFHQVFVIESGKKEVSSSQAHKRVSSSLLFRGRTERAQSRLKDLTTALRLKDWRAAFEITWAEFWDMHALFETSDPAFSYMTPASLEVLRLAQQFWKERGDGPLVTMDAGANVHMLYRPEQKGQAADLRRSIEGARTSVRVLESET